MKILILLSFLTLFAVNSYSQTDSTYFKLKINSKSEKIYFDILLDFGIENLGNDKHFYNQYQMFVNTKEKYIVITYYDFPDEWDPNGLRYSFSQIRKETIQIILNNSDKIILPYKHIETVPEYETKG